MASAMGIEVIPFAIFGRAAWISLNLSRMGVIRKR